MLRYFGVSIGLTVAALVTAVVMGGPAALLAVVVLSILEVSLSFDNAVVNAKVLNRMSLLWRRLFLYVGIFIAVFGMRLVLPIILVAVTANLSPGEVWSLALNSPDEYAHNLEEAKEAIYSFGGMFLAMIFLDFVFDEDREIHWLSWLERPLARVGRLEAVSVTVALAALYATSRIADPEKTSTVLTAGILGVLTYLVIHSVDALLNAEMGAELGVDELEKHPPRHAGAPDVGGQVKADPSREGTTDVKKAAAGAGFSAFLYLEVLDASFSFDGVIGAFAISSDILVIALGLGIGAFWVRSMTIYLVDKGTLAQYRYLEHGAHWAIGVLATIMLLEMRYHISEYVTGITGVIFILAAFAHSIVMNRREGAERVSLEPDHEEATPSRTAV